jgi:hypothetical protein
VKESFAFLLPFHPLLHPANSPVLPFALREVEKKIKPLLLQRVKSSEKYDWEKTRKNLFPG